MTRMNLPHGEITSRVAFRAIDTVRIITTGGFKFEVAIY